MAEKLKTSKRLSEDKAEEPLSKEVDKLNNILTFMRNTIKESNLPWVSWRLLEDNAGKILGSSRRPEYDLWAIMQPVTHTLVEKENEPKAENPEFYEYKIGNAWVYFPAEMISLYCGKQE
jgi:hypothetical protein